MRKVFVVHGPNLNLLGTREPGIYGQETLDSIREKLETLAGELDVEIPEGAGINQSGANIYFNFQRSPGWCPSLLGTRRSIA